MFYIVGLGNPGVEYDNTRHNTGRMILEVSRSKEGFSGWREDVKLKSQIAEGKIGTQKVALVMPDTFMNRSGQAVGQLKDLKAKIIGKGKEKRIELESLVLVHDDLDLPFGTFKISFNKSSGGHRGVESVIKAVGTEGFIRVRVGISPATPKGVAKKPHGEEAVNKFILAKFKPVELAEFKKMAKKVSEALAMIVAEGREKAMGEFNKS